MVLAAMNSGVSGLQAESDALGVVGDNIANVNTVGFKSQRAVFEDVLGHSILAGTSTGMPGSGVRVGTVQQMFTQGTLQNTGVSTDIALNGDGFFVVKGTVDGISANFYTRSGEFLIDKDGKLSNTQGLKVQGYQSNGDGTFAASLSDVTAPTAALPARKTQAMMVTANLDARAPVPTLAFDITDPANTSSFSTTMSIYDSLGIAHTANIYFARSQTVAEAYDYHVVVPTNDITPTVPPTAGGTEIGTGSLNFDANGALASILPGTVPTATVTFANASAQDININFGTSIAAGGTGLDGVTQFGSPSNVSSQSQDGYASGDFSGVQVDGQGIVTGLYTNGQKIAMSQLAVAKFRSNDNLGRAGQNVWIETRESGPAAMGTAGSGGRGATTGGALEGSNVDLATEFVSMIQHQRSFSANSKTITTADEMLQELINIKR